MSKDGIAAEEIVFFDDRPSNIETASQSGIDGFVVKDIGAFRAQVKELAANYRES